MKGIGVPNSVIGRSTGTLEARVSEEHCYLRPTMMPLQDMQEGLRLSSDCCGDGIRRYTAGTLALVDPGGDPGEGRSGERVQTAAPDIQSLPDPRRTARARLSGGSTMGNAAWSTSSPTSFPGLPPPIGPTKQREAGEQRQDSH